MTDRELKEFSEKRIEILKDRIKKHPADQSMLKERMEIYEGILQSIK